MADKRISELETADALAGGETVPVVQGGVTRKATILQILAGAIRKVLFTAKGQIPISTGSGAVGVLDATGATDGQVVKVKGSAATGFEIGDAAAGGGPSRPTLAGALLEYHCDEASGALVNHGSAGSANLASSGAGTQRYEALCGRGVQANEIGGAGSGWKGAAAVANPAAFTLMGFVIPRVGSTQAIFHRINADADKHAIALFLHETTEYTLSGDVSTDTPTTNKHVEAPYPLAANVESHFALRYDGSNLELWINGDKAASTALAGSVLGTTGQPFSIGDYSETPGTWKCFSPVRDLRLFPTALTADEIRADANTGTGWT